jgi:hypothetical protein
MHIYINTEPWDALPLCYSPLNFRKKKDKMCKPHYEVWEKKIKNMIVKLLLLETLKDS